MKEIGVNLSLEQLRNLGKWNREKMEPFPQVHFLGDSSIGIKLALCWLFEYFSPERILSWNLKE